MPTDSHSRAHRNGSHSGASLIELAIIVSLISILALVVSTKIWELRITAEQTSVDYMVGTLRSALAVEVVSLLAKGRSPDVLTALDGLNPIELLEKPPANYLGALSGADPTRIAGYHWYFDRDQRLLIYRVQNGDYLRSPLKGPPRVRFRVMIAFKDIDDDGVFTPGIDSVQGVDLMPAEPFAWKAKDQ